MFNCNYKLACFIIALQQQCHEALEVIVVMEETVLLSSQILQILLMCYHTSRSRMV